MTRNIRPDLRKMKTLSKTAQHSYQKEEKLKDRAQFFFFCVCVCVINGQKIHRDYSGEKKTRTFNECYQIKWKERERARKALVRKTKASSWDMRESSSSRPSFRCTLAHDGPAQSSFSLLSQKRTLLNHGMRRRRSPLKTTTKKKGQRPYTMKW